MSALSDALQGIRQVLLLQDQVKRLETLGEKQTAALGKLSDDLISIDKRVVRIETMIEMSARAAPQPRIEDQ
jgi:hypothetical protein